MSQLLPMAGTPANANLVGLTKNDYRGNPTTLCAVSYTHLTLPTILRV